VTTYYVSPTGININTAPGSLAAPWATFAYALASGRLQPGDTLLARGGTYYESGVNLACAGTAGSRITIQNYPNETPVIDGGLTPEFRTPGNSDWTLYDAGKNIYRSVNAYTSGVIQLAGWLIYNGRTLGLMSYKFWDQFSQTYHFYTSTDRTRYLGPGVYWADPAADATDVTAGAPQDSHVYIRLVPPIADCLYGRTLAELPSDLDPRHHSIVVSKGADGVQPQLTGQYYDWSGISCAYHNHSWRGWLIHCTLSGFYCRAQGGAVDINGLNGTPVGGEDHSHDFVIDGVTAYVKYPRWVTYNDIKGGQQTASRLKSHFGSLGSSAAHGEIKNCVQDGGVDGWTWGGATDNIHIHNCTFGSAVSDPLTARDCGPDEGIIFDDTFQINALATNVEIAHNLICGPLYSHDGAATVASLPGTKWVHHNRATNAVRLPYMRKDVTGAWNPTVPDPTYQSWAHPPHLSTHANVALPAADPVQFYNNTLLCWRRYGSNSIVGFDELPHVNDTAVKQVSRTTSSPGWTPTRRFPTIRSSTPTPSSPAGSSPTAT
jgi:hypothetical protein